MVQDTLAESVERAWNLIDSTKKIPLVIDCWKWVLSLIILGKGDNTLVESCCSLWGTLVENTVEILVELEETENTNNKNINETIEIVRENNGDGLNEDDDTLGLEIEM